MLSVPLRVEERVNFGPVGRAGRKGVAPPVTSSATTGRILRVSRLMALAIKFEGLVRTGAVRDYAELARLGRVTRARVSQIMNLLMLAPDIQEAILFLEPIGRGRDPIAFRELHPIAVDPDWQRQRRRWRQLSR